VRRFSLLKFHQFHIYHHPPVHSFPWCRPRLEKGTNLDACESGELVSFHHQEIAFNVCQSHKDVLPTTETKNWEKISLPTPTSQNARKDQGEEKIKGKILSCKKRKSHFGIRILLGHGKFPTQFHLASN